MSNAKNLIPNSERTPEERREIARKGGKASGISRGFRSAVKKRIRENPELIENIIDELFEMAIEGRDLKAMEMLIDLNGESPRQQEIKIKQKDLKIKQENAENNNW